MKSQMNKKNNFQILYHISRILPEIVLIIYLSGMMFTFLFLIPTFLSIGVLVYHFYLNIRLNDENVQNSKKIIFIFNIAYSLYLVIIGCILLAEGNFGASHAPIFFIIGIFYCILEITKYTIFEKKELPTNSRIKNFSVSLILSAIIISALILVTINNSGNPPVYTQEDLDNAIIAYEDIEINGTLEADEVDVYKTWHEDGNYLSFFFKPESNNCSLKCSYIKIRGMGGSGSIETWKKTIYMNDAEGWVYFYIFRNLIVDEYTYVEYPCNQTIPVNYTFSIISSHFK